MPKLVHKMKMVDPDDILTKDDIKCIEHTRRAEAAGKLVPLEKVMEELGVRVRRRAR